MAHHNTVLSPWLKLIPRHEFETLAKQHHQGRRLRQMTRWAQFVALSLGQLAGRVSLRDIVANLAVQSHERYHLGIPRVSRASLARVNAQQPHTLYEALFNKLLCRCQGLAPTHGFRFKNKLYSLDSTTLDLCLSVFPWATFRQTKGAIKLHIGLDHGGYLPAFMTVTEGKAQDVTIGRTLKLPRHSIVVFDRGYTDYIWYQHLHDHGIFFVTRQKSHATYAVVARRPVPKATGLTSDQTIHIQGKNAKNCPMPLRRIGYSDPETGKHYVFLTNHFQLAAKTIADIYKARWQIELFFKWIKQNLKIKTFLGTSKNAVLTQIWVAMCVYLLLAYLKFCSRLTLSFQQMLRLLQLNVFARRDLMGLLKGDPPTPPEPYPQTQPLFA